MTKKKLLTILLIAVAVLAVAGTAVGLWLGGVFGGEEVQADTGVALYWNLERDEYVATGMDFGSGRQARPDGLYYITFGCNGEKLELCAARKDLVDKIDMLEVMCLEFDEEGIISGVYAIEDYGYEIYNRSLFVSSVEGNTVYANNSPTYLGMNFELTLEEDTQIYDVSGGALLGYQPCQPKEIDEIVVITNPEGKISHLYVKPYVDPKPVYLNTQRMYSSSLKASTREPDALGYFTYTFAVDGELFTYRCRDQALANSIDKTNAPLMDLIFDDEGLIIGKASVNNLTGGKAVSSWYYVDSIDGKTFTTYRNGYGNNEHIMTDNCKVVNNTDTGEYRGELTDLRVGDRVHCLTDSRGNVCYILIVGRPFEGKIGLNQNKKYDSTNKVSTRTPADDGYYYIPMHIDGKEVTVKTKDKAVIDKLDSFFCYGVKLDENNEVIKYTSASNVYGGSVVASYYDVTEINGNKITAKRILSGSSQGKVTVVTAASDCEVYLATDSTGQYGAPTEVQVGDRIHCFTDVNGSAKLIYVVNRPVSCSIYWNMNRQYNSTTKETKRVPDEDGFYWFDFAVDGKQVRLKTRQKSIATKIDANSAKQYGLLHWKGEITKVISCSSVKGYEGGVKGVSWVDIIDVNGKTYTARKYDTGKIYTFTIGNACKVYNVDPDGIVKYVGEPTDLRVGDRVHAHHNVDGLAMLVFVVDYRVAELDTTPNTCPCAENVKWEPWDGNTPLENGKSYYLTQNVVAPAEGFKLEGISVNIRLNGYTISSPGRVFWAYSNSKLNICDHDTRGKLLGSGVEGEAGGVIRSASTATVNLWNIDVESKNTNAVSEGGLLSVACKLTAHNVTFRGGKSTGKGGNVYISTLGTFRAFDSTFENGVAGTNGGNIDCMNRMYLENCTVTGGSAAEGDNIYLNSSKDILFSGVTVSNPANGKNMYIKVGTPGVDGKLTVTDGSTYNIKINSGKLQDMGMTTDSKVGITCANLGTVVASASQELMSCVTLEHGVDQQLVYENGDIRIKSTLPPKPHSSHCVCVGGDMGLAEHTCTEITDWKELTFDVLKPSTADASRYMFIESGNYYLTYDLNLSGSIDIRADQKITICLNGCKISSNGRTFALAGELNITDCDTTGVVQADYAYNGGAVKLHNGSTFNLYGGTLTNIATAETGGAAVVVSTDGYSGLTPSTKTTTVFNMYGGKLSNCKTSGNGGHITLFHTNCYFNMYGGIIENGTATKNGGNVRSYNNVKLLGGTITGGKAAKGNDVYYDNGELTLGGKMNIGELTIANGLTVTIADEGLTTATPIKLAAGEGVFATNVKTDLSACFKAAGNDIIYDAEAQTLSLKGKTHTTHCLCMDADLGLAEHTCTAIGDWKPLTEACFTEAGDSGLKLIKEGNYFLTEDLVVSKTIYNQYNHEVNICLNGYTISCPNNNVFTVSGVLNITDCVGTGCCQGNSTSNGGSIRLARGGELNIYAGTYKNSKAVANGGGVVIISRDRWSATGATTSNTENKSVFNLYGGTLTGGMTTANGGNVSNFHAECEFNMYGGTITGGKADGMGGNLKSAGTMNILGGTIKSGTAPKGGNIYYNSGTMTLGGNVDIDQITISGKKLVISDKGLTVKQPIEVIASEGVFATNVKTDLSGCFKSEDLKVVYNEEDQTLSLEAKPHPEHCACNDADLGLAPHTCDKITEWTPLTADCFTAAKSGIKFVSSGNYYLTADYETTEIIYIQYNQKITICLNGFELSSSTQLLTISGELTITDCVGTGKGTASFSSNGGVLRLTRGGTLNVYGGTYTNTKTVSTGGAVVVVSRDNYSATGSTTDGTTTQNKSTFNMYGGTLKDGKTTGTGGNLTVFHSECTFNMYGGTIEGGTADANGGGMRAYGTTNLLGGKITGGKDKNGCTVFINGGTLTIGGDVEIDSISLNGKSFKIHSSGWNITTPVKLVGSGKFATNVTTDMSALFEDMKGALNVVYDETAKTLTLS